MKTKSMTRFVALFAALTCLLLSGCGGAAEQRDFTQVVSSGGTNFLKITCQYVGKQPGEPEKYVNKHDYRSIDTDFYKLTFENLTEWPISISGVTYRMEKGPMRTPKSASVQSIQETWGTSVVPAKGSISRANNLVWSKTSPNALVKTYKFEAQLENDSTESFSTELRFAYQR